MEKKLNILLVFLIVLYKNIMYWPMVTNKMLYLLIFIIGIFSLLSFSRKSLVKKQFMFMITLIVILIYAVFHSESANLLFPIFILFSFYNQKNAYKDIAKYYFFSLIICLAMTMLLNGIGVLPSYNITRSYIIRYSLGYIHPGFVYLYFLFICVSGYYAFNNDKKLMLILTPFALLFYKLSLSRTGIVCFLILLILSIFYQNRDAIKFSKLTKYLFFILTILTIVSVKLYDNQVLTQIDFLFSGRLANFSYFINNGLLTNPFGKMNFSTTLYTIDNLFLVLFYDYGYIGYILYGLLTFISIKKNITDKKFIICMFVFLIYGMCDSNTIVTSINFLIPIQLLIIFDNSKKKGGDLVEKM